ncbi:gp58-like family protein [Lactobacillus delbrueckii subsp. allosunkii]|uniref:gp58-like family protein n=1 Tax=Lactobacillus delbrueckii TaxID=1584 RepID=UPI003A8BE75A
MKSRPVSVNVTANGLAANQAQQTANQAVTSANKYKMAWDEANSETIEALNTAQKEFESNLAWVKSQIYEGQHQNDSAVASLRSDMESSWNSMSTVEESLYNSTITATSEVDSHLESLRVQNSLSLADLHSTANSLHDADTSLHSNMDTIRGSLNDTRNSLATTTNNLANVKTSLEATGNSLATTTSELQRQTWQLSGSLSTANSMIMFNSDAIAEVKHTAEEVSTTVSNIRVGGRNLLSNTRTLSDVWSGDTETVDGFTVVKATQTYSGSYDPIQWGGLSLKSNTDYVLTFSAKASKQTLIYSYLYNIGTDTVYADGSTPNTLTTDYQRYVVHFHTMAMPADRRVNCLPVRLTENGVTAWIYGVQLEEGNTATQWQPNPNDTDQAISKVSQTADAIRADLTNAKGDVASVKATADSLTTQMTNTKGDVASVKATADSLTTQMTNANGNISQLQQTAKGLQSTVTDQSDKLSQLKQDADGISATVGGAAIDLISNLDQPFVMGFGIPSTTWDGHNACVTLPTTSTINEVLPQDGTKFATFYNWEAGKTYMQSIIFETDATVTDGMKWTWYTAKANGHMIENATLVKLGNNTYRLIGSHTPTASEAANPLRVFDIINFTAVVDVTTGTYLKFRNPRIWCPDDNSLAQLKLTADGLTSKVSNAEGNVSGLQQTASKLQSDLTNAKGDISSVKQTADSLTSRMTNAEGNVSSLQQRADSITSTLSNGGVNLLNNSQGDFQPNGSAIDNWQRFDGVNVYMTQGRKYTVSAQCGPDGFYFSDSHVTTEESNRILLWLMDDGVNQIISSDTTDISKGGTHFTWNYASGLYTLRVNSYKTDNSGYAYHVQIEYGDTATPWKPSNGDISSLQQTASGLTADMKDAKGNISSLQDTASQFTTRLHDAEDNVSSLQLTSKELDTQIKAVDGRATSIKETADGISARVSRIEGNNVVGSLLKLDGNEAGLGTYVNNKLIAGINTNPDGVCIEGKNIHLNGQTHIDDGVINASKITVYNTIGDNKGNQYLAVAWGQLNSTIGSKDDQGNTLWGSINQTSSKLNSYYQELKNDGSSTRSLIQQKADQILLGVDQKVQYKTYTVSASSPWDFNYTKSIYENWFINGDTSGNYFYNGPDGLKPWVYVQSRGSADGTRFVVTVWRDYDPTQYQRVWNGSSWSKWVMLPNSQNLVSAINLSPDGVKISGKKIELDGNTKIRGQLNLLPTDQRYVDQRVQGFHNPWAWRDANVFAGNGGLQLQSTIVSQRYSNDNTPIYRLREGSSAAITTLAPTYLKFTVYPSWNDVNNGFTNQLARTYIDAGRIETNDVWVGNFRLKDSKMHGLNDSLYVTNWNGTNFDNAGSVGFQVWSGIGLGRSTIYTPTSDLYIQIGNVGPGLGAPYSSSGKVNVRCNRVISERANTVSSRLSVKTAITKVTYERALMAVQNTDMYDYRYTTDDTGQHYVSGIIDDIHDKPEYNMDPMLINKERTARIDANLLGYHQVVLQEILKRLDKLEAK